MAGIGLLGSRGSVRRGVGCPGGAAARRSRRVRRRWRGRVNGADLLGELAGGEAEQARDRGQQEGRPPGRKAVKVASQGCSAGVSRAPRSVTAMIPARKVVEARSVAGTLVAGRMGQAQSGFWWRSI